MIDAVCPTDLLDDSFRISVSFSSSLFRRRLNVKFPERIE